MQTRKIFKSPSRTWVGECPQEADRFSEVPAQDDPRWIKGSPDGLIFDVPVLTLSPFYPSGRLGACVEIKPRTPPLMQPNHPPFAGAVAWMPLGDLNWTLIEQAQPCTTP